MSLFKPPAEMSISIQGMLCMRNTAKSSNSSALACTAWSGTGGEDLPSENEHLKIVKVPTEVVCDLN